MNHKLLEVCVDSVDSALAASRGGADRLELCSNLIIGGTTPSPILYKEIRKHIEIPIHVLIRPRFGDFHYSDYEFEVMKGEVDMFRELKADGVVLGILDKEGELNTEQMELLIEKAGPMSITLHRAFDVCKNPLKTLKESKELGIHTILTSGQRNSCIEGKELLRELVIESGSELDIMVGSGLTPEVLKEIMPYVQAKSYHMSGKVNIESSMNYRKEGVNMGLEKFSEYEILQTNEYVIKEAKNILNGI